MYLQQILVDSLWDSTYGEQSVWIIDSEIRLLLTVFVQAGFLASSTLSIHIIHTVAWYY